MLTKIQHFNGFKKRHMTYFCLGFDSSGMKHRNVMCTEETFFLFLNKSMTRYSPVTSS